MNKSWFYLGVIGSLAVLTTSCGGDAKPPTPTPTPAVTASPAAAVPPTTPVPPVAATPGTPAAPGTTPAAPGTTAATPATPGKSVAVKPVSVDVAAGLIAPTDGESWAKTVSKGRSDPFGMLALQPVEIIEPIDPLTQVVEPKQASAVTKLSPLPTVKVATISTKTMKGSGKQRIASNPSGVNTGGNSQLNTVSISAIPRTGINRSLPKIVVALREPNSTKAKTTKSKTIAKLAPTKTSIPKANNNVIRPVPTVQPQISPANTQMAAITKPEKIAEKPLQAMAIEISGVIEVNGETQVIIKLPTESFSRYIAVGERIGNGKVLVKRVEGQNGLTPTVVLEEVGVEVLRKIGEKSEPTNQTPQP
jgi:hypothetical protein